MDVYTFIATMTGHLSWPLATLLIVTIILFRLRWLAKFIKGVKYKDLELSIREDFSEARVAAEVLEAEMQPSDVFVPDTSKVARLMEIDPSIAIIDIWRRLEQNVIRLIQHNGFMRFTTPSRFVEYLTQLGKLSERELVLYRKLRDIRNASVHAHDDTYAIAKAEVFEFNRFAELLMQKLEAIRQEPGYLAMPPGVARSE
jgi:hypothetical protein